MKNANQTSNVKTNATTKKNVANKKTTENKKSVVNLNLSQFAAKLDNIEVKEKKDKETLYIYPETLSKSDINGEKGKKHRNKLRTKMQKFENNIFVFTKTNDTENLEKTIAEFDAFYKENYRTPDYSLKSISSSNDEKKTASLKTMLEIINAVKSAK